MSYIVTLTMQGDVVVEVDDDDAHDAMRDDDDAMMGAVRFARESFNTLLLNVRTSRGFDMSGAFFDVSHVVDRVNDDDAIGGDV